MAGLRWFLLLLVAISMVSAQVADKEPVTVPKQVAALLRPILDLRQESITECERPGEPDGKACATGIGYEHEQKRWWRVGEAIAHLASQKTPAADEALVVLMCYYTGESGDNEDAVVNRGQCELPYLLKYQNYNPVIPEREYSVSMRLDADVKNESFQAAISAIRKGQKRE